MTRGWHFFGSWCAAGRAWDHVCNDWGGWSCGAGVVAAVLVAADASHIVIADALAFKAVTAAWVALLSVWR